ncbi:TonB-dependent receptor [Aquimarina sp. AD10]|uniref:SusC/RagA family TonB-linked outer membrane protein n=1 Tax=Aquimarina sp. AD10 TaxID=1714849 RepID=UPI000E50BAC5|nr:TonB-dependent receptor [Aquimarina sp. AD10]AXT62550.1 TonB-dependent receptor [Aquimarina sp. AD10]RKM97734.1 SusC/RagA family TonB-linked outer membrane protein [Aquimarina sp. AD10]
MKSMILKKLIFLLVFLSGSMLYSQITVSGVISDGSGPVPGVNVLVRGTSNGSVSDFDGKYTLDNVASDAILVFSYVGFKSKEVSVNGQTTINVTLEEDAAELEQVVVIGYGSIRAKDATGAVATVKAKDFNGGVISSPEQLIQGKTAGVQITQTSGEPGAGINLRIRGTSSVRSNNNPLYVVDGFPLNGTDTSAGTGGSDIGAASAKNPLNFLNPNDIASIDILKDASATAIYGSRGANGVVIISTKKAKVGVPLLEFSSSISTGSVSRRIELLDRAGYLAAQSSLGADLSVLDQGADTDWQDVIFRNSFSSNYNVAFGGAEERGGYRFSVGYSDQEGVVENSGLERFTARFNGNYSFFDDKLKLETQLTVSDIEDERAPVSDNANARGDLISTAYYSNPTLAPFDANGIPTLTGSVEQINPAALLFYITDNTNTFRTFANLSAEYSFTDELSFKTLVGIDKSTSTRAGAFSSDLPVTGVQGLGRAQIDDLAVTTGLWEAYFNYNKEIDESNTIDALLGYSYQRFRGEARTTIAADFRTANTELMINNIGSASAFGANSANVVDELQSYFGRVNYSHKGKYLLTATVRADGSTRFGDNNKYGYFPSFAAAWRMSDEDFIPEVFTDLKLRVGYGITGNQEIPSNQYVERTRFGVGAIDNNGLFTPGGEGGVAFNNPDLQWEETSQFNLGLDFGFLNGRINGQVDFYRKVTSDLLIQVTSAQPAVNPFVFRNLDADVINQGVEFLINATVLESENFFWDSSFNIAYNKNEVQNYTEAPLNTGAIDGPGLTGAFAQQIADGQPLYAYFLREFTGFDANGIAQYVGGVDNQKFTGDSPLPDFTLGFSNSFKYKDFDLTLFLTGQFGHKIYNNNANALFTVANLSQGRNVSTDAAALIGTEDPFNAGDVSTRFLENGSFLRLQDVTLGYNFDVANSKLFNSLRLFMNAQNLFVITDYSGQDPEVSVNKQINGVPSIGIDYTAFPRARTFTLGLNVAF